MTRRSMTALVVGLLLLMMLPGMAAAKDDGKSDCKKGGWEQLVRAYGMTFANQDACVSYVARGGTTMVPPTFQSECGRFGGTYVVSFTCSWNGVSYADFSNAVNVLRTYCSRGYGYDRSVSGDPDYTFCY